MYERLIKSPAVATYRTAPNAWHERLTKKLGTRNAFIVYVVLIDRATYAETGIRYGISKERVRQIIAQACRIIRRSARYAASSSVMGEITMAKTTMTQADFDLVKEHLFRGETRKEIRALTGRSPMVITLIANARDLAEYRKLSHAYFSEGRNMRRLSPDLYKQAGEQFAALLQTVMLILKTS